MKKNMRFGYMERDEFEHILAALTPENRLACEVSACTGLRIGAVLNLRSERLQERMTVRELKTGKTKRIRLPAALLDRLVAISGKVYVFEGRLDYRKHRTRQAVYKDLAAVQKLLNHEDEAVTMLYAMADQLTERRARSHPHR